MQPCVCFAGSGSDKEKMELREIHTQEDCKAYFYNGVDVVLTLQIKDLIVFNCIQLFSARGDVHVLLALCYPIGL